jgi:hypothetical protein
MPVSASPAYTASASSGLLSAALPHEGMPLDEATMTLTAHLTADYWIG